MIESILDEIKKELNKQYPGYDSLFNPPATGEQLAAYEKLTGFPVPEDLKKLYTLHNGQRRSEKYGIDFFFSLPFLTLDESMQQWKFLNAELGDYSMFNYKSHSMPPGHVREQYLNRNWIPFCKDSGGNYIGVDLDPDVQGTVGQVINFGRDEDTKYVIAPGLEAFLTYMLTLIRANRLSILEQEDDNADEEEDDDGNVLPLPKVYRFAFDGSIIWHFLDWLKVLELPGKPTLAGVDKNYHSWLDSAPDNWKALINANCRVEGIGFVPPAYIIRFYPGKLPVDDLNYIHYLKNLREVILSGSPLTDIHELKNLPLIKILFLSNSGVKDLDVLRSLPRLQYLSATKLSITDLRPLEGLPLVELNLERTAIADLEPLSKISTLRKLDISYTNVNSMSALAGLEGLTSLNISGSKVSDLSFLDGHSGLRELELYDLSIDDYAPLFRSRHITRMTCSFDLFKTLKLEWKHTVNFSIRGEMTDEEKQEWRRLR